MRPSPTAPIDLDTHGAAPEERPGRVRWLIVGLLVGFSMVSYIDRMNISVAAKFMMPELGLSQIQIGQVFSAFLIGYSLLQVPMGMLGDRFGPSRVLVAIAGSWAILTLLTGLVPGRVAIPLLGVFGTLVVIRFLLGVSISGVYPLAARTMAVWQPLTRRAFAYSLVIAGVSIGSAVTPPAVAWLMVHVGWRQSFYWAALLSVAIALLWSALGADDPESHRRVNAGERRLILGGRAEPRDRLQVPSRAGWWRTIRNRSVIVLCTSYFLSGYVLYTFVFWFYIYLVDVRKFSILASGAFGSMPFIVAGVLSPIGGVLCDWATAVFGQRWGRRVTGIVGPLLAATCLIVGARTSDSYFAVAALSLSFGFQMSAESAVWSTAMDIGGRFTGMTTGIVNTANNLGGVVSTALMPVLVAHFGWVAALDSCAAVTAVGAVLWLGVRPDQSVELECNI
jgi:ACS family glucarate transporter-like MFS transporter